MRVVCLFRVSREKKKSYIVYGILFVLQLLQKRYTVLRINNNNTVWGKPNNTTAIVGMKSRRVVKFDFDRHFGRFLICVGTIEIYFTVETVHLNRLAWVTKYIADWK